MHDAQIPKIENILVSSPVTGGNIGNQRKWKHQGQSRGEKEKE